MIMGRSRGCLTYWEMRPGAARQREADLQGRTRLRPTHLTIKLESLAPMDRLSRKVVRLLADDRVRQVDGDQ